MRENQITINFFYESEQIVLIINGANIPFSVQLLMRRPLVKPLIVKAQDMFGPPPLACASVVISSTLELYKSPAIELKNLIMKSTSIFGCNCRFYNYIFIFIS